MQSDANGIFQGMNLVFKVDGSCIDFGSIRTTSDDLTNDAEILDVCNFDFDDDCPTPIFTATPPACDDLFQVSANPCSPYDMVIQVDAGCACPANTDLDLLIQSTENIKSWALGNAQGCPSLVISESSTTANSVTYTYNTTGSNLCTSDIPCIPSDFGTFPNGAWVEVFATDDCDNLHRILIIFAEC